MIYYSVSHTQSLHSSLFKCFHVVYLVSCANILPHASFVSSVHSYECLSIDYSPLSPHMALHPLGATVPPHPQSMLQYSIHDPWIEGL